jgi:hypothetical protein
MVLPRIATLKERAAAALAEFLRPESAGGDCCWVWRCLAWPPPTRRWPCSTAGCYRRAAPSAGARRTSPAVSRAWPGGFLKIFAESQFGPGVNLNTGAIAAVNTNALFPVPNDEITTLSSVQFTQFFTDWFGVFGVSW